MASLLRSFFVEFQAFKRVRIHSKSLRVPELAISTLFVCILFGTFGCNLSFMTVDQSAVSSIQMRYDFSQQNWWTCSQDRGDCILGFPAESEEKYCHRNSTVFTFDEATQQMRLSQVPVSCRYLDMDRDVRQRPGSVLLATRTLVRPPRSWKTSGGDVEGGWWAPTAVGKEPAQYYTFGVEQHLRFEGTFNGIPISSLQGFIQHKGERTARRIRRADSRGWTRERGYWATNYPEVSGGDKPDFSYSGSGCLSQDGILVCHLSELLAAAGIADLDYDTSNKQSVRAAGGSLTLRLDVTNVDPLDFWRWPFGPKLKFVIYPVGQVEDYSSVLFSTAEVSADGQTRVQTDRHGLHITLDVQPNVCRFDISRFLTICTILLSAMNLAKAAVVSVVIRLYRFIGMDHVSTLFEYNASSVSAKEEHLPTQLDHATLEELHRKASHEHFTQLLPKGP